MGFREGQTKARELGLYMQKYCGCVFSEEMRYNNHNTTKPSISNGYEIARRDLINMRKQLKISLSIITKKKLKIEI